MYSSICGSNETYDLCFSFSVFTNSMRSIAMDHGSELKFRHLNKNENRTMRWMKLSVKWSNVHRGCRNGQGHYYDSIRSLFYFFSLNSFLFCCKFTRIKYTKNQKKKIYYKNVCVTNDSTDINDFKNWILNFRD